MNFRRGLSGVCAVMLLAVFTLTVYAESLDSQLSDVQNKMSSQQSKASQAQQEVDSISGQLRILQADLQAATQEYESIQNQLSEKEKQIEKNTEILEKTERDLAKRMKILNKRIRDVYQNGQINYIDVLFGATDFNDLLTRMDLLKRVIKHDYELIMKVKAERELILQKKAELESDRAAIVELKKAAEIKQQQVKENKAKKQVVLDRAVNDRNDAERAYQELLETSKQIEQMIRAQSMGSGRAVGSTGAMMWPVNGVITSEYGWRTHPIFGTSRYHSGLDIGADYGDPIVAADGGTVIYAEWMGGYGNAVIIDHGGGITTLYGHNDSLIVGVGQQVSKGQQIAICGSTGYSTGPHCHFEVRQNGEPVDPYGYL